MPIMPNRRKSLRQQLADANQEARRLASRVYELENDHPLRAEIARLEKENVLGKAYQGSFLKLENALHTRLSDAELVALAAYVSAEGRMATPARDRLQRDLEGRGILASGKVSS